MKLHDIFNSVAKLSWKDNKKVTQHMSI